MSQIEDTDLQLLLTDAEELVPVLENGLPEATLGELSQPGASDAHSTESEAAEHDPNDLATQRWAVIAPAGDAGGRMLEAIQALVEHRKAQQGAAPRVFRVPPAMDIDASLRWRDDVLRGEDIPLDERPRYLLILGDLHEVSLSLQQVLASDALVGRLQCPTIKGFRDYAEKVVAREKAEPAADGRALFYTVQDGTAAIGTGYGHLIEPCMKMTQDRVGRGSLSLAGVEEIPYSDWGPDDMLAQVGVDAPSVLLSLTHGLGAPRKGWRSPDHQRATQGALSMGLEKPLTADAVVKAPFLPGGVWFCQACFAAGTPDASGFSSWLSRMAERGGHRPAARDILRSLPAAGERPFVAALPQTLLANPRGPLAVLGHADLAWTFGFVDPLHSKSRASRLFAALQAVLAGNRVGVALDAMTHARRELDEELARHHRAQRDALARGEPDPVAPRTLGRLWIQRNDLRGHVLLGDPAARLPIKSTPPPVRSGPAPQKPARKPPIEASPPIDAPASPAVEPAQRPAPAPAPARAPSPPVESPAPPVIEAAPAPNPPSESPVADSPATSPRAPAAPHASAPTERIEPRGEAAHNIVLEAPSAPLAATPPVAPPQPLAPSPAPPIPAPSRLEVPMSTTQPPPPAYPPDPTYATAPAQAPPTSHAHAPFPAHAYAPPPGAAPLGAMVRPRTLENPEIALRERAVLAMLRGDEAPRSIAVRFGLPLEEVFYWLDVYREAGRKALGG